MQRSQKQEILSSISAQIQACLKARAQAEGAVDDIHSRGHVQDPSVLDETPWLEIIDALEARLQTLDNYRAEIGEAFDRPVATGVVIDERGENTSLREDVIVYARHPPTGYRMVFSIDTREVTEDYQWTDADWYYPHVDVTVRASNGTQVAATQPEPPISAVWIAVAEHLRETIDLVPGEESATAGRPKGPLETIRWDEAH